MDLYKYQYDPIFQRIDHIDPDPVDYDLVRVEWSNAWSMDLLYKDVPVSRVHIRDCKAKNGWHWYLHGFGTHPRFMRRGFGTMLIKGVLERAKGMRAYVVSTHSWKMSEGIFRKLGFIEAADPKEPWQSVGTYMIWRRPNEDEAQGW